MIEQQTDLNRLQPNEWNLLPPNLQWRLVAYFRQHEEFARARALLDQIEAEKGVSTRLYEQRALLAAAEGNDADALPWLRRRALERPSATAWIAVARHHLERGELADAHEISDDLLESDPDLMTVALLAADVALAGGDRQSARDHLDRALGAFPDNLSLHLASVRLALAGRDRAGAEEWWTKATRVVGDEASITQAAALAEVGELLGHADDAARFRAREAELIQEAERDLSEKIETALTGTTPTTPAEDFVSFTAPVLANPAAPRDELPESNPNEGVALDPRVLETLQHDFGHTALRPGQVAVIERALAGRDTLAIMPTGAGKSLTFQLPAMMLPGTTLVISPLIALMKDQLESLPETVRERSALINSSLSLGEIEERLRRVRSGQLKMLYIAPERFRDHRFLRALQEIEISLAVVDEAHCISLWGSDFRPDYLFIPKALAELGDPPLLAVTATATPAMARQIAAGLGREPEQVRISIFRPNLFYQVFQLRDREQKISKVIEISRQEQGTGIVYVRSRKDAESIAGVLRDNGVNAVPYHAGLDPQVRAANQERFMSGKARVVVATVAFGMGVDKADVRFIIHQSPPDSLEAYAQESGRAGRDGQAARCVMLATPSDAANLKRMARNDEIGINSLRQVYATIKSQAVGAWAVFDAPSLEAHLSPDPDQRIDSRVALGILEQAGLIVRHPDAPDTYTIRPVAGAQTADAGIAKRLDDWLATQRIPGVVSTAAACQATGLTPFELDRLLIGRGVWEGRPGKRGVCVQFLPPPPDIGQTMSALIERARANDDRRIDQVIAYVKRKECRHLLLAAHLGERLDPCGTSCDVCQGTVSTRQERQPRATSPGSSASTAEDALAALKAVRTLPFPMGRTGLTKLLIGSLESRVREDRAPSFGALAHLKKSAIERLINRLVEDGFLERDLSHEFMLISMTTKGREATAEELADYGSIVPSSTRETEGLTDPADQERYERLAAWRRGRLEQDEVPGYVIATNAMLRSLAIQNPRTVTDLRQIAGFGQSRIEKYGAEIIDVLSGG